MHTDNQRIRMDAGPFSYRECGRWVDVASLVGPRKMRAGGNTAMAGEEDEDLMMYSAGAEEETLP